MLKENKTKMKCKDFKIDEDLGYILGVINGDGHIWRNKEIQLSCKDEDFALAFKKALENYTKKEASINFIKNKFYRVLFYSKELVPIIKQFNINLILKNPNKVKCAFLKGLFDSDGHVNCSNLNNLQKVTREIGFSNSNKEIIDLVKNILENLKIKCSIYSRIHSGFGSKKLQYELYILGRENMIRFSKNIRLSIKRKQNKLKKLLKSYKMWSEEEKELLKKDYACKSKQELLNLLPKRTPEALRKMAYNLNLKKKDGKMSKM